MTTSNKACKNLVNTLVPFNANHLFAEWVDSSKFVIYSYRKDYPIYINFNGVWYSFKKPYFSSSTARHISQTKPDANIVYLEDVEQLKNLLMKAA